MTPDKRAAYVRWLREQAADIAERLEDGRIDDIHMERAARTEYVHVGRGEMRLVRTGWHTLAVTWVDPSTRGRTVNTEDDDERMD